MTRLKGSLSILALAIIALLATDQAYALSIATFNIEYFSVSGKKAYSNDDCRYLAETIKNSGADVLALQEIKDDGTMRLFTTKFLPGWGYAGNDTGGRQDLYFIWNKRTIKLDDGPIPYGTNASFVFQGKSYKLNDRPHLTASFVDIAKNFKFRIINVHLKSQSTRGKEDKERAELYNTAKRRAQIEGLKKLAHSFKGPVFIMGDYNTEKAPSETGFPLLRLEKGYSYDNKKSNLDYIGYLGIDKTSTWKIYEVESSIPGRSTKRTQHPDHDVIVLELN